MDLLCTVLIAVAFFCQYCAACTDKIYIGTWNPYHLAISTDGGETWTNRDPTVDQYIYTIAAVGEHVYVGTGQGLAVSSNGGLAWKLVSIPKISDILSVFASNSSVYAGSSVGMVATSNDYGQTWPITVAAFSWDTRIESMYVQADRIYAGSWGEGLGVSLDNGKSWRKIQKSQGLLSDHVSSIAGRGNSLYVGMDKDGATLSISDDAGQSWGIQNTTRLGLNDQVNHVFVTQDKVYVATDNAGLAMSNDVWKKWVNKSKLDGLASNKVYQISAVGNNVYAATDAGLSISRDGGQTWTTKNTTYGLPGNNVRVIFAHCV